VVGPVFVADLTKILVEEPDGGVREVRDIEGVDSPSATPEPTVGPSEGMELAPEAFEHYEVLQTG
jgi:hypothetical protein